MKKEEINKQDSKEDSLKEIQRNDTFGSLKPLGKILGNNIFTFHRPNLEDLFHTLNSLPEPKYWLTSENFLLHPLMANIHAVKKYILTDEFASSDYRVPQLLWKDVHDFLWSIQNEKAMLIISLNEADEIKHTVQLNYIIKALQA